MSTRSATIIMQTTYWGEEPETEELMRFYRHCDGYPEGHGIDMAEAIAKVGENKRTENYWYQQWMDRCWCQQFLAEFLAKPCTVKFEPFGYQHGDVEYLYVVEGIVDNRKGAKRESKFPVTISVYGIAWDEDYDAAMERTPIFSGTAYEYIERFGKKQ